MVTLLGVSGQLLAGNSSPSRGYTILRSDPSTRQEGWDRRYAAATRQDKTHVANNVSHGDELASCPWGQDLGVCFGLSVRGYEVTRERQAGGESWRGGQRRVSACPADGLSIGKRKEGSCETGRARASTGSERGSCLSGSSAERRNRLEYECFNWLAAFSQMW